MYYDGSFQGRRRATTCTCSFQGGEQMFPCPSPYKILGGGEGGVKGKMLERGKEGEKGEGKMTDGSDGKEV